VPSSCASVACSTRTGTAAATSCVTFSRSLALPSSAAASQAMLIASAGTLTGHTTSFAAPAASTTSCGGRAIGTRASSLPPPAAGQAGRALQRRPHLHLARRRVAQGSAWR
jgi:hypothetical protein